MALPLSRHLLRCLTLLFCIDISLVVAQSGDGGGAGGVEPGDLGAGPTPGQDAGADGPDSGSVNLSKGATIAIALVVTFVVVIGGKSTHEPSGWQSRFGTHAKFLQHSDHDDPLLGSEKASMENQRGTPQICPQSL
jgi:hypothetical protein